MIKFFGLGTALLLLIIRIEDREGASLGGRITDESQKPISAATVSATNVFSREVQIARSDGAGLYKMTQLRQGRYSVLAEADGYGCIWLFNVVLFRERHTQLDIMLRRSQKGVPAGRCSDSLRSSK